MTLNHDTIRMNLKAIDQSRIVAYLQKIKSSYTYKNQMMPSHVIKNSFDFSLHRCISLFNKTQHFHLKKKLKVSSLCCQIFYIFDLHFLCLLRDFLIFFEFYTYSRDLMKTRLFWVNLFCHSREWLSSLVEESKMRKKAKMRNLRSKSQNLKHFNVKVNVIHHQMSYSHQTDSLFSSTTSTTARSITSLIQYVKCLEAWLYDYLISSEIKMK